ncbi:lipocalin family protein [Ulvibacterium sp.]|uniref:lipocalin family protein n=1 Tax=Ulvibacterium sp. TaxID=2665914 RepID=UPI002629486B|nr:lipocalin family protein [Ulvibacterium sp.]
MKTRIVLLFLSATLFWACSSDNDDGNGGDDNSLIGTWSFTELKVDDADGEIKLANEVIQVLIAQGCDIFTFEFKSDQTLEAAFKDFTETGTDVNSEGTGLLIECPENAETTSSTWSLEGDQLTIVDGNGISETVTIKLEGGTLTLSAEIIDEDNLEGAEAVFKKD